MERSLSSSSSLDESGGISFPLSPDQRKVVEVVIKVLQKKQGFLSLQEVHQHLLKNEPPLCQVFDFSSEGLLALLSAAILRGGPTYFNACVINHMLYSISVLGKKKMKSIVEELSSSSPRTVMHPNNSNSLGAKYKSGEVSSVLAAKILISCLNNLEERMNGMPMDELYQLLKSEREELMKNTVLENSIANFKQFILDHPVELKLACNGGRVFSLVNMNSGDVAKAVLGVRMAILLNGGLINIKSLMGHLSTVEKVRAVTGGSVESLRKFIAQHPETLHIDSNGDVSVAGGKSSPTEEPSKKTPENQECNSMHMQPKAVNAQDKLKFVPGEVRNGIESINNPRYCRSTVVSLFLKFGFIHNGVKEDENIYFDSEHFVHSSHSVPVSSVEHLRTCLKVGDEVDCLFREVKHQNTKFQALTVWKIPNGIGNELCLQPIYELPFQVLVGSATVSFLNGDVGFCEVDQDQEDSLINFDAKNKNKVKTIGFHLGWMLSKSLSEELRIGSQISLIAKPIAKVNGRLSFHWVAISVWNKKKNEKKQSTVKRVAKAEVRSLTSDGGLMSFGEDLWAHRATFNWESLADWLSKPLVLSVGDSYWCVLSEAHGSTKWEVNQLVPCHLDDNGNPPLVLSQYPSLESSISSISFLDIADIDISSTAAALPAKSAEIATNQAIFDVNLIDLSAMSLISSSSTEGESKRDESVVVEDGAGSVVSRDAYGGMIEGDDKSVVCFGAHAFYLNGRPITHLAFPERSAVHYQARTNSDDKHTLVADKVWVGKKPV